MGYQLSRSTARCWSCVGPNVAKWLTVVTLRDGLALATWDIRSCELHRKVYTPGQRIVTDAGDLIVESVTVSSAEGSG